MEGKGRLVSPDELLQAAKEQMLNGRDPVTDVDWFYVMNFFAVNIDTALALDACKLLRVVYDMSITEQDVERIVKFQLERKLAHA